ncbi:DUF2079 domain-containing protein [bacterium]|nr:DUF2079 domain-containing protein [bacterium]
MVDLAEKDSNYRKQGILRFSVFLFLFYLFISLAFTWPLILHTELFVPGPVRLQKPRPNEDSFQFLWNIWWVSKAIDEWRNPFECPYLFHPQGARLHFHAHTILQGVMAYPFVKLFGLVKGTNIILILQLTLGAFISALLGWEITKDKAIAWFAGIALGFCPFVFGRLQGHWCWSSIAPLILVAWLLLRMKKYPSLISAITLSVGFILLALADSTYLIFGFLLAACLVVCYPRIVFPKMAISVALFILMYSPVLIASYREYQRGGDETVQRGREQSFSADVFEYLTPNIAHPLLRNYYPFAKFVQRSRFGVEARRLWPGLGVLFFVCFLFYRRRFDSNPETRWFILITSISFALSLGSPIHVLQRNTIPFLYGVVDHIPILGYIRAPGRYGILVQLGLTCLAAIGAAQIVRRYGRKFVIAAGIFLLFEFLPAPIPLVSTKAPQAISVLAKEPYGCVWDVGLLDLETLLFQTVHRKPIIGGFYSRIWSYDITPARTLRLLTRRATSGNITAENELKQTFSNWNVRYVLTAKETDFPHLSYLYSKQILTVIYQDSVWTLYRVNVGK